MSADAFSYMNSRLDGASYTQKSSQIRTRHYRHAQERSLAHGVTQLIEQWPHIATVDRCRTNLMATGCRTLNPSMHIRNTIPINEFEICIRLKKSNHFWRRIEEGSSSCRIKVWSGLIPQIGERAVWCVLKPRLTGQRIARNPHPAT
jgi:hypothetical protein